MQLKVFLHSIIVYVWYLRKLILSSNNDFVSPPQEYKNLNFDLLTNSIISSPILKYSYDSFFELKLNRIDYAFNHGVSSGDPLASSVIIWTRITPSEAESAIDLIPVYFDLSLDEKFRTVVQRGLTYTSKLIDYTVKIDVDNLRPGSVYYYRFSSSIGETPDNSVTGRTRTLSNSTLSDTQTTLLIYSCSKTIGCSSEIYDPQAVNDNEVEFVLHLGEYMVNTNVSDSHTANDSSLQYYRLKFASYKQSETLKANQARWPWIIIWNQDAENLQEQSNFVGELDFKTQAFLEWVPIRPPKSYFDIYRCFKVGSLLKVKTWFPNLYHWSHLVDYRSRPDIKSSNNTVWDIKTNTISSFGDFSNFLWRELTLEETFDENRKLEVGVAQDDKYRAIHLLKNPNHSLSSIVVIRDENKIAKEDFEFTGYDTESASGSGGASNNSSNISKCAKYVPDGPAQNYSIQQLSHAIENLGISETSSGASETLEGFVLLSITSECIQGEVHVKDQLVKYTVRRNEEQNIYIENDPVW